jgi:hypothetical protein
MKLGVLFSLMLMLTTIVGCGPRLISTSPVQGTPSAGKTEAPGTVTPLASPVASSANMPETRASSVAASPAVPAPTILPSPEELAQQGFTFPDIARILCEELKQMADKGQDLVLVDVRNSGDFASAHIPGALNIPSQDSSTAFSQEQVDNQLKALPRDRLIVFYCA